jgi:DNA-binding transcriptional ArsR family regulator
MSTDPYHRQLKDPLYGQFARIGRALAAAKRIELLDLLAQGERPVAELAEAIATPLKNTSAQLGALRAAGLVDTRREGTQIFYRLADDGIHDLVRQLQAVARGRLAEVERIARAYIDDRDGLEPIGARELAERLRAGDVTLVDVRPREEFDAGHIPGALSLPIAQLGRVRLQLPRAQEVVAYCRGRYCVYSVEAVELLRRRGYRARRFEEGLPGWRASGRRVAVGR